MSSSRNSSIENLPIELHYRIFDHLDVETIFFSIRPLSKLFQSIVKNYNRYIFDFNLISKTNLNIFSRLINPKNIISIKFSNDQHSHNQITLFLSIVSLEEFTRLQSIYLPNIDEIQLNMILEKILNFNNLKSLSFHIKNSNDTCKDKLTNSLSKILSKSTLRKFEMNIYNGKWSKISFPIECSIQYLNIQKFITFDNLLRILQYSPYLHTIVIKKFLFGMNKNWIFKCFQQVKSITVEKLNATIDEFESFLLLIPSIEYLKLIDEEKIFDGKRWENFISRNLFHLKQFEFYFRELKRIERNLTDIHLILDSYTTPFWIEEKKWFIQCEYSRIYPYTIQLFSIPICKSSMYYTSKSNIHSWSTIPTLTNTNISIMNNIHSICLSWSQSLLNNFEETTLDCPLFPNVTEIDFHFSESWPSISLQSSLSTLIDISQITRIKMFSLNFNDYNQHIWNDIALVLEQAQNLSSLIIQGVFYESISDLTVENIHSILPKNIKYLEIPINDLEQINQILKRCANLCIIQLNNDRLEFCEKVFEWFTKNTINSSCKKIDSGISIWIGSNRSMQSMKLELH